MTAKLTPEQRQTVADNHNLIYSFLRQHHLPVEDYYSAAAAGLCGAVATYDPARGCTLSTWAYQWMRGECYNQARAQRAKRRVCPGVLYSLDAPVPHVAKGNITLADVLPSSGNIDDAMLAQELGARILTTLSPGERALLGMVVSGMTQRRIARQIGVTQTTVSRRLTALRAKINRTLKKEGYL